MVHKVSEGVEKALAQKIHVTCDVLGNPTGFSLTPGQKHDLDGADIILPKTEADTVIADKDYDADQRMMQYGTRFART